MNEWPLGHEFKLFSIIHDLPVFLTDLTNDGTLRATQEVKFLVSWPYYCPSGGLSFVQNRSILNRGVKDIKGQWSTVTEYPKVEWGVPQSHQSEPKTIAWEGHRALWAAVLAWPAK